MRIKLDKNVVKVMGCMVDITQSRGIFENFTAGGVAQWLRMWVEPKYLIDERLVHEILDGLCKAGLVKKLKIKHYDGSDIYTLTT